MIPKKATNPSDSTEHSVVGIDYGAFYYATSLNSVTLPEGLEYIDSCAFQNSSLKSIEIPASVTRLGSEDKDSPINNPVFSGAGSRVIESVTFAENSQLKIIGSKAFQYCENLKELDIPDGVTYIGSMAFGGCDSLANDNITLVTKTCTLTVKDAWTVKLDGVEKKVEKGKSFTFPSAPTKPGYIFLGWRGSTARR